MASPGSGCGSGAGRRPGACQCPPAGSPRSCIALDPARARLDDTLGRDLRRGILGGRGPTAWAPGVQGSSPACSAQHVKGVSGPPPTSPNWLTLEKWAPHEVVPVTLAPERLVFVNDAPFRLAPVRFAKLKLVFCRMAPVRLAPVRL